MKIKKLTEEGIAHIIAPMAVVAIVAIIGAYIVVTSHAATCKQIILSMGSSGQCVTYVQEITNAAFPKSSPILMDGQFGPQTKAQVEKFQSVSADNVDGIVGPETWNSLCATSRYSSDLYGSWNAAKSAGC